ncbi:RING-H2 finger protein ATL34-like [Tetranychus urticae]|uniref:RING-H2 finger protein ATL34-like n=1 Tax=Tetranychus urticae TaxID=32264 RepID=UPI00077BA5D4|nr:RING-H2 finger protein ATL34-like [Tetranychus urticae]
MSSNNTEKNGSKSGSKKNDKSKVDQSNNGGSSVSTMIGSTASSGVSDVNQNSGMYEQLCELIESELKCAICQQLVNNAVNINCSHTFCFNCLAQWRRETGRCPICRVNYSNRSRVLMVDNLIRRYCQLANIKLEKVSPISSPVSSSDSTITNDSFNFITWPENIVLPTIRDVGVNTSPRSQNSGIVEPSRQLQMEIFQPRENRPENNYFSSGVNRQTRRRRRNRRQRNQARANRRGRRRRGNQESDVRSPSDRRSEVRRRRGDVNR